MGPTTRASRWSSTRSCCYSTYFGGNQDDARECHRRGRRRQRLRHRPHRFHQLPDTPGAFQTTVGNGDAFVTELNPTGTALVYSTYLGGTDGNNGNGIAVDTAGNAYVTGTTESTDFPTTPGAFQTTYGGDGDAFVTKLNPTGTALVYSTYLGGSSYDVGSGRDPKMRSCGSTLRVFLR